MTTWEYMAIFIEWDEWREGKLKYKSWIYCDDDGRRRVGMDSILNTFGDDGWELVNLIPETAKGKITRLASADVKGYRVVFKRPTDGD